MQCCIAMQVSFHALVILSRQNQNQLRWPSNKCFFCFIYLFIVTRVDTAMCCPKGKCGCQYFILLTLKKNKFMDTGVLDFFNKKLILDYYFCLKFSPLYLFQIFIIAPSPSQGIYNCIINNKLINNKFRFSI